MLLVPEMFSESPVNINLPTPTATPQESTFICDKDGRQLVIKSIHGPGCEPLSTSSDTPMPHPESQVRALEVYNLLGLPRTAPIRTYTFLPSFLLSFFHSFIQHWFRHLGYISEANQDPCPSEVYNIAGSDRHTGGIINEETV